MERGTTLCAGFGKREHATFEMKCGETKLWGFGLNSAATTGRNFGCWFPMQPAGNHQMQHQPLVVFKANTDSLSQSPQRNNFFAFSAGNWRHRGAQQKWRSNLHALKLLIKNALLQGFKVDNNVRKFRHALS